jgi:hypothetical protein
MSNSYVGATSWHVHRSTLWTCAMLYKFKTHSMCDMGTHRLAWSSRDEIYNALPYMAHSLLCYVSKGATLNHSKPLKKTRIIQ